MAEKTGKKRQFTQTHQWKPTTGSGSKEKAGEEQTGVWCHFLQSRSCLKQTDVTTGRRTCVRKQQTPLNQRNNILLISCVVEKLGCFGVYAIICPVAV